MERSILYCGDTDLSSAASYLAGMLTLWGWEFDYVPSHAALTRDHVEKTRSLFVLSDYPAANIAAPLQRQIIGCVRGGAGLLMIGGWESFHGMGGNWDGTPIGDALPVVVGMKDDRLNFFQPTLLVNQPSDLFPIANDLPWDEQPPTIGGMNRVKPKPRASTLLLAQNYRATTSDREIAFKKRTQYPALVVGVLDKGRVAAFMPDVAPHWVGGFVDWGDARVTAQAPRAPAIEVGNWYAQFWRQLLSWTGRIS